MNDAETADRRLSFDEDTAKAAATRPIYAVGGEEKIAVLREIVPTTLHSLYTLRIGLYMLAAGLTLGKVVLLPAVSGFLLDLATDAPAARGNLEIWVDPSRVLVAGLLASSLALIVATFFIQARLLFEVRRESAHLEESTLPGEGWTSVYKTLQKEVMVAILTGLLTFGISELLALGSATVAGTFALLAAVVAGGLDTLYFHLLFLLREAPVHASAKRYRTWTEQAQARLADGSMRLQEALIGRFEADYRRTATANRSRTRLGRQMREARRQLHARLWVIHRVIPSNHLVAFAAQAETDPTLLERWTEEVDWLVSARNEARRRQSFFERIASFLKPGDLARRTITVRQSFADAA